MPDISQSGMDLITGGGIVGGIVAAVTSFGWWIRKEKSDSAKNRTDIAISDAATKNVLSQSEEIEVLRKRISDLDAVIISLHAEIYAMKNRISRLETGRDIASMHLKAMHTTLCDDCKIKTQKSFEAITAALSEEEEEKDKAQESGNAEQH